MKTLKFCCFSIAARSDFLVNIEKNNTIKAGEF
jgi:hypothetical protein